MRLMIVRHGEPNYEFDTLTERGWLEAASAAERLAKLKIQAFYVSPLGRAQDTASCTLKKMHRTAVTLDWLQEFPATVDINDSPELQETYPDTKKKGGRYVLRIPWDMVPAYLSSHPEYMSRDGWRNSEVARRSDTVRVFDALAGKLDALLAEYGYVRERDHYRVERESRETVTFFCHFGVTCAMLAHLWNVSPFILWHSLALLPTSFTEVVTEERQKGIAYFRSLHVGDTSHLRMGGEDPSFACRFCEVYSDESRH